MVPIVAASELIIGDRQTGKTAPWPSTHSSARGKTSSVSMWRSVKSPSTAAQVQAVLIRRARWILDHRGRLGFGTCSDAVHKPYAGCAIGEYSWTTDITPPPSTMIFEDAVAYREMSLLRRPWP
jgi:hypothetical protein